MGCLDASVLRINDGAPVKVTFLNADNNGHFAGFYVMADGAFQEIKTLFANAGREALIPGVSSVFLGSRLNGKTPVFFVIENGYSLNRDAPWFQEAVTGHGGFWLFLKPASSEDAFPLLDRGKIVWSTKDGASFEPAEPADQATASPVLVWQSNSGRVSVVKGKIFHSTGYGLREWLNPDQWHRFLMTPQNDDSSVELDFIDLVSGKKELSLNLQIGERNFGALMTNRVLCATGMPDFQSPVLSVTVDIPDEFEDTLYVDGFENEKTLSAADLTFAVIGAGSNHLKIEGKAPADVYSAVLSAVKVGTEASAPAKSDVKLTFKTEKEEIVVSGRIDILSEQVCQPFSPTGLPLPEKIPVTSKVTSAPVVPASLPEVRLSPVVKEQTDDLPAFLKQPISSPAALTVPANGKTVLITGGAGRTGQLIAHGFAASGYNVIIHCNTAVAQATRLVGELQQKYHVKAAYFRADFNSYEETADMISALMKTYGEVDVVISNTFFHAKEETAQSWETNTAVNLRAPFLLIRSFAAALPKGREGTFVCVFQGASRDFSSYTLSCVCLPEVITRAAEAYQDKIRVNGLSIIGEITEEVQRAKISESVRFLAQIPVVSGQTVKLDIGMSAGKKTSLF